MLKGQIRPMEQHPLPFGVSNTTTSKVFYTHISAMFFVRNVCCAVIFFFFGLKFFPLCKGRNMLFSTL